MAEQNSRRGFIDNYRFPNTMVLFSQITSFERRSLKYDIFLAAVIHPFVIILKMLEDYKLSDSESLSTLVKFVSWCHAVSDNILQCRSF